VNAIEPFPWENDSDVIMARASYMACAYNAAVNAYPGNESRARRKLGDLVRAINHYERVLGRAKLEFLKQRGIIGDYRPCPPECEMRPGGLFHAAGCENDLNHPVSRSRSQLAHDVLLPQRLTYAASVSLVGAVSR